MDSTLIKRISSDFYENDKPGLIEAGEFIRKGEPIPKRLIPPRLFSDTTRKFSGLPDFFNGSGYWIVSTELADILRQFELGASALYPIKIFQHDRETPVPGRYECLSFGERKETFIPEKTERVRRHFDDKQDVWELPSAFRDDEVAVRETALSGPDLWMETPRLPHVFFLSDPLVQAIKSAKLSRTMGLRRCRVIADH